MRVLSSVLFLGLCALSSSPASAQIPWESPLLVGPESPAGVSLFLVDPGEGLGAMIHWQGRGGSRPLGFRVGLAETHRDELGVFGGVDLRGAIYSHSEEFPLDVVWVTGAGLGISDGAVITFPVGVSLGRVVTGEDVWFHPYLTPRLVIDAFLGGDEADGNGYGRGRNDLDLGLVFDLGADFSFTGSWVLRLGASVGDRDGLAIGLSFPSGR